MYVHTYSVLRTLELGGWVELGRRMGLCSPLSNLPRMLPRLAATHPDASPRGELQLLACMTRRQRAAKRLVTTRIVSGFQGLWRELIRDELFSARDQPPTTRRKEKPVLIGRRQKQNGEASSLTILQLNVCHRHLYVYHQARLMQPVDQGGVGRERFVGQGLRAKEAPTTRT